jgi:SAM-dependent methyltransferase
MPITAQNWFDQGGEAYSRFRPDYPDDLARLLGDIAPGRSVALDVGCGTGQFTRQLAAQFETVVGTDPSADQIDHAQAYERVRYEVGPAERIDLPDRSVDLITAAQAAHWFDLPAFYEQVRRVAVPEGLLALISYGIAQLEPGLNDRFLTFYHDEVERFWPPERKLVDEGYAGIDFPFRELPPPRLEIERYWSAPEFLGYISTWSAARRAREVGQERLLEAFAEDILKLWGKPDQRRTVKWPINMRLGDVI